MTDDTMNAPRVTVVYKPLRCGEKGSHLPTAANSYSVAARTTSDSCLRAENEDDDGYDPYSDRHEVPPLFERNPWD